jgi:hypothetical protein
LRWIDPVSGGFIVTGILLGVGGKSSTLGSVKGFALASLQGARDAGDLALGVKG